MKKYPLIFRNATRRSASEQADVFAAKLGTARTTFRDIRTYAWTIENLIFIKKNPRNNAHVNFFILPKRSKVPRMEEPLEYSWTANDVAFSAEETKAGDSVKPLDLIKRLHQTLLYFCPFRLYIGQISK